MRDRVDVGLAHVLVFVAVLLWFAVSLLSLLSGISAPAASKAEASAAANSRAGFRKQAAVVVMFVDSGDARSCEASSCCAEHGGQLETAVWGA